MWLIKKKMLNGIFQLMNYEIYFELMKILVVIHTTSKFDFILFIFDGSILFRFKCKRCMNQIQVKPPPDDADCGCDLTQWHHCWDKRNLVDQLLKQIWRDDVISFVFHQKSHEQKKTI